MEITDFNRIHRWQSNMAMKNSPCHRRYLKGNGIDNYLTLISHIGLVHLGGRLAGKVKHLVSVPSGHRSSTHPPIRGGGAGRGGRVAFFMLVTFAPHTTAKVTRLDGRVHSDSEVFVPSPFRPGGKIQV